MSRWLLTLPLTAAQVIARLVGQVIVCAGLRIGTQPQAGETVGLWVANSTSGSTAGRAGQFWTTYSGTYAGTGVDGKFIFSGSSTGLDHGVGVQGRVDGGSFTGSVTLGVVSGISGQVVWSTSGTVAEAAAIYGAPYSGSGLANITLKWGLLVGATQPNYLAGELRIAGSTLFGAHDSSSVIGASRYGSGDKFAYINAGYGLTGKNVTTQADTGMRLCTRSAADAQVVAASIAASGDFTANFLFTAGRNANDATGTLSISNPNTGTSSAAVMLIASHDSSGYMAAFPGNYSTAALADTIAFGANSSAANGFRIQVANSGQSFKVLGASNADLLAAEQIGNVVVGSAAIATNATDGFLYIPTCAGTPTGVPSAKTGRAPLVIDSTNNKLYFYSGGAWRDAGP